MVTYGICRWHGYWVDGCTKCVDAWKQPPESEAVMLRRELDERRGHEWVVAAALVVYQSINRLRSSDLEGLEEAGEALANLGAALKACGRMQ